MSLISTFKILSKSPSVKSVGIYTFSNFFSKGISFLLLFVFTNPFYITPSENGLLSLFSTSLLFLMPFLSMGILHSTSADFFKMGKNAFRDFFTTGFVMPLAIMIVSTVLLWIFRNDLQQAYGFPVAFTWLIPVVTFLIFCNEQFLALARNNNEPGVYLKANVSKTVLELGISFVLVVFFASHWQGRIQGILVSYLVTAVYALYYFRRKGYLFGKLRTQYLYSELKYALPIIVLQAAIFSMSASDKFFLSHYAKDQNETVGIYSIACVFASVINILSMALIQYIFPKIYSMLSADKIDIDAVKKLFNGYLAVMLAGLAALVILTPVLYHFFINERYHAALRYCYMLCIGSFLWATSYFFFSFLLYHKDKRKIFLLSVCCIAVSLSCNYFFISRWQDTGAALASVLSYAIIFLLTIAFTSSYWKPFLFNQRQRVC